MAPRRLEEVMLEPEDWGRPSSLNVGRRIGSCSSGDIITSMCVYQERENVVPEHHQTWRTRTPVAFQLLRWNVRSRFWK